MALLLAKCKRQPQISIGMINEAESVFVAKGGRDRKSARLALKPGSTPGLELGGGELRFRLEATMMKPLPKEMPAWSGVREE